MNDQERTNEINAKDVETKSTPQQGHDTAQMLSSKRGNRMSAAASVYPILVSERQFEIVREEHLASMDLLNSSGKALLNALESMTPPEGSGRVLGEYTAQGMRQISKSLCDIVQTKTQVIRAMYSIARDEL